MPKVKAQNPAGAKRSGTEKGKAAARKGKQAGDAAVKRSKSADKNVKKARKDLSEHNEKFYDATHGKNKNVSDATYDKLNEESMPLQSKHHRARQDREETPTYHRSGQVKSNGKHSQKTSRGK